MTLDEKIAEAEAAYHRLMTGQSARVYQDQNGERVEYAIANAPRLRAYIEELKRQRDGVQRSGPGGIIA